MTLGRKTGGRKRGVPNRQTVEVAQRLAELGCDPIEGMVTIASDLSAPIDLRGRMLAELARYVYPQRKAQDVGVRLPLAGTLPERAMACLEAIASGEVTPGQGLTIITAIAAAIKANEPSDLEARLSEMEIYLREPCKPARGGP